MNIEDLTLEEWVCQFSEAIWDRQSQWIPPLYIPLQKEALDINPVLRFERATVSDKILDEAPYVSSYEGENKREGNWETEAINEIREILASDDNFRNCIIKKLNVHNFEQDRFITINPSDFGDVDYRYRKR